jgi:hypothetical protein
MEGEGDREAEVGLWVAYHIKLQRVTLQRKEGRKEGRKQGWKEGLSVVLGDELLDEPVASCDCEVAAASSTRGETTTYRLVLQPYHVNKMRWDTAMLKPTSEGRSGAQNLTLRL